MANRHVLLTAAEVTELNDHLQFEGARLCPQCREMYPLDLETCPQCRAQAEAKAEQKRLKHNESMREYQKRKRDANPNQRRPGRPKTEKARQSS